MEKAPLLGDKRGGDVHLDMTEVVTTDGRPRDTGERVEAQKEMSPSAAILGAMVGNEEARSYLEQKVARVNAVCEGIFFTGSVIVMIVEGATGAIDLNGIGWAVTVLTVYTAGAGTYYARKCDLLVGLSYQIDRLRGQVTRLSQEVDRLAPEVDRLGQENDRYTQLLQQHAAMQTEMESILTGLTAKHQELAEDAVEIEEAVEGLAKLKAQFDKIMPKLETLVDGLKGQVSELTGQVDELEGQVDELQGQIKELDGQVDELTREIDGLEKTRKGLQASVEMLSQLQGEADKQSAFDAKVNEESAVLVARREELQGQLAEIQEKAEALQKEREELQGQQRELIDRESHLVGQLEEHAAKLDKLDKLEGLVVDSAKRKLELASQLRKAEQDRDQAKAAARQLAIEKRDVLRERATAIADVDEDVARQARRVDVAGRKPGRDADGEDNTSSVV